MRYVRSLASADENKERLEACGGHDFSIVAVRTQMGTPLIMRCRRCGGEVDITAKRWYEIGRAHATADGVTGTVTNMEG